MKMKNLALTILMLFALGGVAHAQNDSREETLRRLIVLSTPQNIIDMMSEQMVEPLRAIIEAPEEYWDEAREKVGDMLIEAMQEMMLPIVDEYYTDDELRELLRFHESPLGIKSNAIVPRVLEASYRTGNELGNRIMEALASDMHQKGYIDDQTYIFIRGGQQIDQYETEIHAINQ